MMNIRLENIRLTKSFADLHSDLYKSSASNPMTSFLFLIKTPVIFLNKGRSKTGEMIIGCHFSCPSGASVGCAHLLLHLTQVGVERWPLQLPVSTGWREHRFTHGEILGKKASRLFSFCGRSRPRGDGPESFCWSNLRMTPGHMDMTQHVIYSFSHFKIIFFFFFFFKS